MVEASRLLVGVDIGSTMVRVVVARVLRGEVDILGIGSALGLGVRQGVVVDAHGLVLCLRQAIDQAQEAAGVSVGEVYVSIAGPHIQAINSQGAVGVEARDGVISDADRQRALDAARTVAIPFECEILHVLARDFDVDGQRAIHNPAGMSGVRLGARVHIVTGGVPAVRNLMSCVERAGLRVAELVFAPLAAARACLTQDELDMGVCLIDVGGGKSAISVFEDGTAVGSTVLPVGGTLVTGDLAVCLRTSRHHAEILKRQLAHGQDEVLQVEGVAGRPPLQVPRAEAEEIVEARLQEIFSLIGARLDATDELTHFRAHAGVVLTGGSCQLPRIASIAQEVLGTSVRIAMPIAYPGIGEHLAQPEWSTVVGLVLTGADRAATPVTADTISAGATRFDSTAGRMRSWLENWF